MTRKTRPIAWIKAARKDFEEFPLGAQQDLARALTVVAEGGHPDIAKPLTGLCMRSRRNRKAGSAPQKPKPQKPKLT